VTIERTEIGTWETLRMFGGALEVLSVTYSETCDSLAARYIALDSPFTSLRILDLSHN